MPTLVVATDIVLSGRYGVPGRLGEPADALGWRGETSATGRVRVVGPGTPERAGGTTA